MTRARGKEPAARAPVPGSGGLVAAVAANAAAGTLFAWSVLLAPVSADLDVPARDLGVVFSAALAVFALAVLVGGPFVDRYGPRRVTAFAGVLTGVGVGTAATGMHLPLLVAGFAGFGAGSGLAYLAAVTWAGTRGPSRRTRTLAVVVTAYAAGPIVAGPVGSLGAEHLGWRATLGVAAVSLAVVLLVASRGLPGPLGARPRGSGWTAEPVGDGVALFALWLLFLLTVAPGLLGFAYAAQVAVERGVSAEAAGFVVALMAAGNLAGRLLTAPVATWLGLVGCLWAVLATTALSLTALSWGASVVALVALPLLALGYGMVSAALPAATRDVSGDRRFGSAYGRVFSSFGVAGLLGPYVGAVLHDGSDGYARGFAAWLAGTAVAALALVLLRRRIALVGRAP